MIRIANLSLCYWIDNVNFMKVDDFRKSNPQKWGELMWEIMQKGGHPGFMRSNLKNQERIVWIHPRYANSSQTDVEELTRVEFLGREKMLLTHEFFKKNISPVSRTASSSSPARSWAPGARDGSTATTW